MVCNKAVLCRYLMQINWPLLFIPLMSCEEKWQVFQEVTHSGLKIIMPAKSVKICAAVVPWMNESLKFLIMNRQKAFRAHMPLTQLSFDTFVTLSTERGKRVEGRTAIHHLKGENPKRWGMK